MEKVNTKNDMIDCLITDFEKWYTEYITNL